MEFKNQINSFSAGIVHPDLNHRTDIEKVSQGCKAVENFTITDLGGADRRLGCEYVEDIGSSSLDRTKSIYAFKQSPKKTFKIELFFSNIFSYRNYEYFNGTEVKSSTAVRIYDESGKEYPVLSERSSSISYNIRSGSTEKVYSWTPSAFGGIVQTVYTIFTDPTLIYQTTSIDNKLIFVHETKIPFIIERRSATASPLLKQEHFVIYPITFDSAQFTSTSIGSWGHCTFPVDPERETKISGTDGALSVQFPTVPLDNVGKVYIRYNRMHPTQPEILPIINFYVPIRFRASGIPSVGSSEFFATPIDISYEDYEVGGIVTTNAISVFTCILSVITPSSAVSTTKYNITHLSNSQWSEGNFPIAVTNFRGRPVLGGSEDNPNKIWVAGLVSTSLSTSFFGRMAKQDEGATDATGFGYYNITANVKGIGFTAGFNDADSGSVSFVVGRKKLHVGSTSGEHQVELNDNTFTYGSITSSRVSSYKMDTVQPVEGDNKLFYVADNNTAIRFISTESNDYESLDLSASIIYRKFTNIKQLKWSTDKKLVYVLDDTKLKTISLNKETSLVAVSEHYYPFDVELIELINWRNNGEALYIIGNIDGRRIVCISYNNSDIYVDMAYRIVSETQSNIPEIYREKEVTLLEVDTKTAIPCEVDSLGTISVLGEFNSAYGYYLGFKFKSKIVTAPIIDGAYKFKTAVPLKKRLDSLYFDIRGDGGIASIGIEDGESPLEVVDITQVSTLERVFISGGHDFDVCPTIETDSVNSLTVNCLISSGTGQET